MRILQLGKFYPIRGGVEKVMWDLTRGLSAIGVPCDMLCAATDLDDIDSRDKALADADGTLHFPGGGRVIRTKAVTKKAATMIAPGMISYLRRHKGEYDIVHIHHPDPMAALSLRLSGFRGRVVLHWHSDILSQKFFLQLYKPLQRWLIRRADRIVGTTPTYLAASPYLKDVQHKCVCIPIGIEPVRFDEARAAALRVPGKTTVLSVGRLVPYKGYEYLIEAAALLPEEFRTVIVGGGPLGPQLEAKRASLGLKDRVMLAGYVTDEDLPAYFGSCDLFVLPSVMKTEAFGIVQLEAMSCGKPVIATDIPGSGTAWVAGSGKSVPPRDPQALARAVIEAAADRSALGAKARERYLAIFTLESMINKTKNLYEEIL